MKKLLISVFKTFADHDFIVNFILNAHSRNIASFPFRVNGLDFSQSPTLATEIDLKDLKKFITFLNEMVIELEEKGSE